MPKGLTAIGGAAQRSEGGNYIQGDRPRRLFFKLDDGASAIVRFLDPAGEVKWALCHDLPEPGQPWGRPLPCRDQDEAGNPIGEKCPGCEKRLPRKFKGWINLIWRDAPVFARDTNGRKRTGADGKPIVEGSADQLAVWSGGITAFRELQRADAAYGGLTSRDFKITRRGQRMQSRYAIEPANPDVGTQPMSTADDGLAARKSDLTPDVTPLPYETWGKPRQHPDLKERPDRFPADISPFMKRPDQGAN